MEKVTHYCQSTNKSTMESKETSKTVQRQYIRLYLLIILILGIGSTAAIYQGWLEYSGHIKIELVREANITNIEIESTLVDANKLLDVAKNSIINRLDNNSLNDRAAHELLNETHKTFSTFIVDDPLNLTLYIDESGKLKASSNTYPAKNVDLSDRLYFTDLKNHPEKKFCIGNPVIARTTNLSTFHISIPLIDKSGKFRGILVQQILTEDLSGLLKRSLDGIDAYIAVHRKDGQPVFLYPDIKVSDATHQNMKAFFEEKMSLAGGKEGAFEIPASKTEINTSFFTGFAVSNIYGLISTVTIPIKSLAWKFAIANRFLLANIVISFLFIIGVFLRAYQNALKLNHATQITFQDQLTKLNNRRALDTEFPKLWKNALRNQKPISALFIDIDYFKKFNDLYGHENGDRCLQTVALTINNAISRPLDFCCRWGGEEFVVVLPETDSTGAIAIAELILDSVRQANIHLGDSITQAQVTVSIGIATTLVTPKNVSDDLIDQADKAMYKAKQSGRDRYSIYGANS